MKPVVMGPPARYSIRSYREWAQRLMVHWPPSRTWDMATWETVYAAEHEGEASCALYEMRFVRAVRQARGATRTRSEAPPVPSGEDPAPVSPGRPTN